MPSATGGFHEVLTKSLNELLTLLAAEHDLVVGELQRRLLQLECKAAENEAEVDVTRRGSAKMEKKASPDRASVFSDDIAMRRFQSEGTSRESGVRQFIRSAMRKRAKAQMKTRSQGADGADRNSQVSSDAAGNEMSRTSVTSRVPRRRSAGPSVGQSNTWSPSVQPVWPTGASSTEDRQPGQSSKERPVRSAFTEGSQPGGFSKEKHFEQFGPALSDIPQPRRLSKDGQNGRTTSEGARLEDHHDDKQGSAVFSHLARTDHQFPPQLSFAQRLTLAASNPEIAAAVRASANLSNPGIAAAVRASANLTCGPRTPSPSDQFGLASNDVLCDRCGNAYLADSKFCRICGKRRPDDQLCSCGNIFAPDAIFCRHCGKYRGLSNDSDDSKEEEEELFQLDAVAPLDGNTEQINHIQSDMHFVVTPAMSMPVPATSTSFVPSSPGELRRSSPAKPGESDNSNRKDPKMPGKLRTRREKAARKSKDHREEGDCVERDTIKRSSTQSSERFAKNTDQTNAWDSLDTKESFAGDDSKKQDSPEYARARGPGRSKTKEGTFRAQSPSPNAARKPAIKKETFSSDSESDTDSEQRLRKLKNRRKSVMKAQTTPDLRITTKSSADDASEHSTPSEERVSAVNSGVKDTLTPRKSLPVRFSHQRKLSRVQTDADEQSNVTPPAQPQAEEPQPPSEAAPPLPVVSLPGAAGENFGGGGESSTVASLALNCPPPLGVSPDFRGSLTSASLPLGRNNGSLLDVPGIRSAGGGMMQGTFLTHMQSLQSNGSFLGVGTASGGNEFDDGDMFELLGVWNMQLFRKSMRVQKHQANDVEEEDMDDDDSDIFRNEVEVVDNENGMSWVIKKILIQPSSVPHLSWEMVGLLLIMWDVITIPLDVYGPSQNEVIDFMSWFLRIFWLLDLIVSFMTGYLQDQGTLEMRPVKIAKHYLRTWFFPDVICVSLDWATVVLQSVSNLRGLRIVRAVRLFRLLKAPEIEAFISEHIHSDNVILTGNIIKSIILLMGAAHIIACVWYMVGQEASDPGAAGWVRFHDLTHSQLQDRYMWSLQWALGQFTGENVYEPRNMSMSERTYAVIVLILTFLFSAMFVSSITTSVTQLQLTKSSSATQLTTLRRYLVDADISTSLAVRVLRNAQHLVDEQKRNVPEGRIELLAVVSEPLRAELHFEVHGRILREHSFFDFYTAINPQGMRKVCHMAIHSSHVSRGDIIFSDLETPAWPRMFFTVSGKLQYKQVELKPQILTRDQWAAEAVLWTLWMHVGTLRALGESDILAVEAEKFQHIISPFPTNHAYLYSKTFVECLNTVDDDTLTDLDAKMVEPYLKYIFPEKFNDHEASAADETRISGAVLASLSQTKTNPRASDYEEDSKKALRSRTDPLY